MHDLNRRVAEGFYRALASRDAGRIASYLSDDVDWMSIGRLKCSASAGRAVARRQ
jgi:hypothetical protein